MEPEFEEKVVQVNRASKKTKGGNRIGFSVLTVVGDKKGRVGVGLGKAPDVRSAIVKGLNRAKKHLISVPMRGTTIPHQILVKKGAAKVLLKPAPGGTGLKTGGAVRAVVEVAGIRDLVSKILGTRNRASNVYATFEALKRLRPMDKKVKAFKAAKNAKKFKPAGEKFIKDLNLSTRTKNALTRAGIETVDKLKSIPEEKTSEIKGLGKKGLEEIRRICETK